MPGAAMAQIVSMCVILPIHNAQCGAGYPESQLKSAKMC